jgi:predicted unusual protein kinase regulating ubiquinone biosynthesis (AarF/ABC1/UbiB family)
MSREKESSVPKGKARRSVILGSAVAKAGADRLVHLSRRPFLSADDRQTEETANEEAVARTLFNALSTMRGTALKIAQMLALESEWLPLSIREELAKSSYQVPPMNRAMVLKALRTHFGPDYRAAFREIDLTAFAAASIGQVHAARHPDGRELAVKIQYPGIAEAIASDVYWLRTLLRPTRYHALFEGSIAVVERGIEEELDYTLEAAHTRRFRDALPKDRYAIPEVFEDYSSRQILTTQRIGGKHLKEWLATHPESAERNHFGQAVADAFVFGVSSLGCLHADPNPGNLLFLEDGRLGLIDFGCVMPVTPEVRTLITYLRADEITDGMVASLASVFGFEFRDPSCHETGVKVLRNWLAWVRIPFAPDGFDFADAAAYFRKGEGIDRELLAILKQSKGNLVYLGRTVHGLFRILGSMGAKVRFDFPVDPSAWARERRSR